MAGRGAAPARLVGVVRVREGPQGSVLAPPLSTEGCCSCRGGELLLLLLLSSSCAALLPLLLLLALSGMLPSRNMEGMLSRLPPASAPPLYMALVGSSLAPPAAASALAASALPLDPTVPEAKEPEEDSAAAGAESGTGCWGPGARALLAWLLPTALMVLRGW